MCEVCCADAAIEATKAGSAQRFLWATNVADAEGLMNNPLAPPLGPPADVDAATTAYLLVQAEGEEEGSGRVRAGFEEGVYGPWIETHDVASLLITFAVDVAWPFVPEQLRDAIQARDVAAFYATFEARERVRKARVAFMDALDAAARAKTAATYRKRLAKALVCVPRAEGELAESLDDWRFQMLLGMLRTAAPKKRTRRKR
jgi:hypothetical protein